MKIFKSTNSSRSPNWRAILFLALSAALFIAPALRAQSDPIERTFTESRPDVEKAVAAAKEIFHGKLPALEGFVGQTQHPVERYERAYYQCLFQVIPSMSGEVSVRVTAKVTAWYADPDKQKSGYEVLPSNGRLENDALDRVEESLEGGVAPATTSKSAPKYNLSAGSALPRRAPVLPESVKSSSAAVKIAPGVASEQDIQDLRKKRVVAEKRVQQLNIALQNLQELLDNQARPSDLVAIKKDGTPVFSRPDEGGKSLFAAAAKDQFQILELKGEWARVAISGESRGWIHKSQLEFLQPAAPAPDPNSPNASTPSAADAANAAPATSKELFKITREEITNFPGTWAPLQGKRVKVLSVQPIPANAATSASEKRAFVKALFTRSDPAPDPNVAGIVVVFDSADGGQASSTLDSLTRWRDGKLSEAAFWQQCQLDPPDTFALGKK
jgi:hypothetical protein